MIANSTQVSNRLFRTQRLIILIILSAFFIILLITSIAAHRHIKEKNPEVNSKESNKLASYYGSVVDKFWADKSDYELEAAAEEEEATRLEQYNSDKGSTDITKNQ